MRISVCHCLACQRRSGSAFAVQARWPNDQVVIRGERRTWERVADSGAVAKYFFCPNCGATVAYVLDSFEGVTAVPVGAYADPSFPPPRFSVYENRKHEWVEIRGEVDHSSSPSSERKPGRTLT